MGSQSRKLISLFGAIALVGCNSSVELPEQPASAPPAATVEATPKAEPAAPERVEMSKPVNSSTGTGYLGGIASGYRHARERIEDLPVQQAIQFFWASEGRYPKSHEEFMEKVIKANQMTLPEIEEGYKYEYDPEDHIVYKVLIEEEAASAESP